jgi:hypothetical protein
MSTTRIYHNVTRLPIVSTVIMIWGTYEAHRIYKGTHPYWSPRLEAGGILGFNKERNAKSGSVGAVDTQAATSDAGGVSSAITWTSLNGIPIPTLAAMSTPTREE